MDFKKDYYAILEITKDASPSQVKRAYRNLALKWHPDRVPDGAKEEAEQIFKEIVEAFYVIGNQKSKVIMTGREVLNQIFISLRHRVPKLILARSKHIQVLRTMWC